MFERRPDEPTFPSTRVGCLVVGGFFGSLVGSLVLSLAVGRDTDSDWPMFIPLGVMALWLCGFVLWPGNPVMLRAGTTSLRRRVASLVLSLALLVCTITVVSAPSGSAARPIAIGLFVVLFGGYAIYSSRSKGRRPGGA